jgi:hypothetical protein
MTLSFLFCHIGVRVYAFSRHLKRNCVRVSLQYIYIYTYEDEELMLMACMCHLSAIDKQTQTPEKE